MRTPALLGATPEQVAQIDRIDNEADEFIIFGIGSPGSAPGTYAGLQTAISYSTLTFNSGVGLATQAEFRVGLELRQIAIPMGTPHETGGWLLAFATAPLMGAFDLHLASSTHELEYVEGGVRPFDWAVFNIPNGYVCEVEHLWIVLVRDLDNEGQSVVVVQHAVDNIADSLRLQRRSRRLDATPEWTGNTLPTPISSEFIFTEVNPDFVCVFNWNRVFNI